jgi:hypothetical protein
LNIDIKKAIIPIALTFLLGPGAGHIFIGKVKKGLALFGGTFVIGILFFYKAAYTAAQASGAMQDPARLIHEFYAGNPKTVFYFDIIFAAIWAYAFVDVFFKSQPENLFDPKSGEDEIQ